MLEYRRVMRQVAATIPTATTSLPSSIESSVAGLRSGILSPTTGNVSHAARHQTSGLLRLNALKKTVSASAVLAMTLSPGHPPIVDAQSLSEEEQEARAQREDEAAVEAELRRYIDDGILGDDSPELEDFDILRWWQVSHWHQ
jgi:hypothetical protein